MSSDFYGCHRPRRFHVKSRRAHTFEHHAYIDDLAGVAAEGVVVVDEHAAEDALVAARVVKGDVGDVDGTVLEVQRPPAAAPLQAPVEALVRDPAALILVAVQLREVANRTISSESYE